jgi:hypothetical protein
MCFGYIANQAKEFDYGRNIFLMTDHTRGQDNAQIRLAEEQVTRTEDLAKDGAETFGRGAQGLGSAVELWAEQAQQQHRALRKFVEGSFGSYMQLLNTPASYLSQQAENQQQQLQQTFQQIAQQFVPQPQQQQQQFQEFQQMSQQWVGSYMGFVDAQLTYAQDAARRAQGLPPIKDYDQLSVDEVVEHLDELSVDEIGEAKAYERRNKNRESLIKRMEQKINASSTS